VTSIQEATPATNGRVLTEARNGPGRPTTPISVLPKALAWLAGGIGVLAAFGAAVGTLWRGEGDPYTVTTFRGQTAEIYGRGLYQHDTVFAAGNNLSSDLVTLCIAIPLLAIATRMAFRGSIRARLLLLGTLGYFLYIGVSYAFAVAYNPMFLAYIGVFSASLFALVLTFRSFDRETVRASFPESVPRRGPGIFLLASGAITLAIWLEAPITSLLNGSPPKHLDTYSTLVTHAFDIGLIVPGALLAGTLILRRNPFGYVAGFSLLVLEATLMPFIVVATILQVRMGVSFTAGEAAGPIAGFTTFALLSVWVIVAILRRVPAEATIQGGRP
jgi:hypothetical protein